MNSRWLALLPLLICCSLATAESEPLSQVEIEAKRAKLQAMEAQLDAFEDQFFAAYNRLNTKRAYKVHCASEMDGYFRVHHCRPAFQEWAEHAGGLAFALGNAGGSSSFGTYSGGPDERNTVALRTREYQKHLVMLVTQHPELLGVLEERAALAKNYEAFRQELLRDEIVLWD
jgi:hypothetical protein